MNRRKILKKCAIIWIVLYFVGQLLITKIPLPIPIMLALAVVIDIARIGLFIYVIYNFIKIRKENKDDAKKF